MSATCDTCNNPLDVSWSIAIDGEVDVTVIPCPTCLLSEYTSGHEAGVEQKEEEMLSDIDTVIEKRLRERLDE